jgi:superfamily II RNA helicase
MTALKTPEDAAAKYLDLTEQISRAVNKAKKFITRERDRIISEHPSVEKDSRQLERVQQLRREIEETQSHKLSAMNYVTKRVDDIISFLSMAGFASTSPDGKVNISSTGLIASQIQEVNALAISLVISSTEAFKQLNPCEIVGILSCLVPVGLQEEKKAIRPNSSSEILNSITMDLQCDLNRLQSLETRLCIESGENYDIQFDTQQYVMDWYVSENQNSCHTVIEAVNDNGISTGDFVKAVLKICNAVREIGDAAEMLGYQLLSEKLAEVPGRMLKYVVTTQSLYL